jgi:hypothetical protein
MIQFPDIEGALVGFLKNVNIAASTKVPNPRPAEFVTLRRTGGVRVGPVTDTPLVDFEAYAANDLKAQQLGERVRGLISERTGIAANVYRVGEVGGLANLPDPDTTGSRYVFKAEFRVRGSNV